MVLLLLVAAVVVLFFHDDPRQYRTTTESYGTSDVVTYSEAALSLTFTAAAVLAGWFLAPVVTHGRTTERPVAVRADASGEKTDLWRADR